MYNDKEIRDWLTKPGNNFCVLPFTHMAIEANGDILPCCMGEPFDLNIKGKTIQEVYNDPIRAEFVDSFRRNEQHPLCKACWKDPYIRTSFSTNGRMNHIVEQAMDGNIPEHKLRWLEIKPGNRCNLKCRICGIHNSSTWAKDTAAMEEPEVKFKNSKAFKYTQSCDWIEDDNFWNEIDGLESIEYIHFMGGEPYMVPEHFQLLERLVEHPTIDTSKINIQYNTNGTYFPTKENQELYKNFGRILIAISIDDINDRFEYQRSLAKWEEIKSNLIKFKKLNKNDYYTHLDPTISLFNIFYLEEIFNEFAKIGFTSFKDQEHYVFDGYNAIHILPQPVKDIIIEKYKNTNNLWILNAIKYMNSQRSDKKLWKDFINSITHLDILRKENFKNIFPAWSKVIKPYYE
mgnify:CR=1 FL=1|tara:strand:+ start:146 stop:1354 length:1209 start_codon:yes stop_codon:yes gene_type:complete